MTRVYQPIKLEPGQAVSLDDKASHYLARVLRCVVGDEIILFNGLGGEYTATITQINKKNVSVTIGLFNPRSSESPISIHLAQGIAKGEKMDFIVQKAVELGVNLITPLITERCNVRLDADREEKRWQHWQGVAISACEQSGRNTLPNIAAPIDFKDWLAGAKAELTLVLSPHVKTKLEKASTSQPTSILLLIGPEGGLSQNEINWAIQQGFKPLNLGPRILRTETATIAALTTLQYEFGDMS